MANDGLMHFWKTTLNVFHKLKSPDAQNFVTATIFTSVGMKVKVKIKKEQKINGSLLVTGEQLEVCTVLCATVKTVRTFVHYTVFFCNCANVKTVRTFVLYEFVATMCALLYCMQPLQLCTV